MWNTTLCYIEREGQYLMLHRVKKENDINKDKWIGIGGKFEDKESPEECLVREVREETGLTLTDYTYRGLVTFVSDRWVTEYMHLFTARTEEDPTVVCDEGDLEWVEGTFPTPYGVITIRHEIGADGQVKSRIDAPAEVKIIQ